MVHLPIGNLQDEAKLNYDERMGCYETSLLLKQGYYNYTYLFVPEETQIPTQAAVDGNFYQNGSRLLHFRLFYTITIMVTTAF